MSGLQSLVTPLLSLCRQAGEKICEHYHSSQECDFAYKKDNSPVTQADLDAHDIIVSGLESFNVVYPVLSEEAAATHNQSRLGWECYWLVDPLDGTREFLSGSGDFSINIALIHKHRPVLGILYLPLLDVAYIGIPGVGAESRSVLSGEGSSLRTRHLPSDTLVTCLSRGKHRPESLRQFTRWCDLNMPIQSYLPSGGALKFCHMVEGKADCYPRFMPCCEWDVAAGQAILEAAGGCVVDLHGQPLRYNCRDNLYSPHFVAIADPAARFWQRFASEHGWSGRQCQWQWNSLRH